MKAFLISLVGGKQEEPRAEQELGAENAFGPAFSPAHDASFLVLLPSVPFPFHTTSDALLFFYAQQQPPGKTLVFLSDLAEEGEAEANPFVVHQIQLHNALEEVAVAEEDLF